MIEAADLWRAWLAGVLPVAALPAGAISLLLVWHLVGGEWGRAIWPALTAAARSVVVAAVLFLPVLANMGDIYPWVGERQEHAFRALWLDETSFTARTVLYFAVWIVLSVLLTPATPKRRPAVAAVGAILHVPVASAAAFDWIMTLDPHFISSIVGLLFIGVQLALALSFAILATLPTRPDPSRLPGLAGLLMAAILFWAYCGYMQLLVIWSGDEPAEIAFYEARSGLPWQALIWFVAVVGGVIPFFALLSPAVRAGRRALAWVAGAGLLGQVGYLLWLVLPWWRNGWLPSAVLPAGLILGIGALWLVAVRWLAPRGTRHA